MKYEESDHLTDLIDDTTKSVNHESDDNSSTASDDNTEKNYKQLIDALPNQWKREYNHLAWARDGNFPYWPSHVIDPHFVPPNIQKHLMQHHFIGKRHVVYYYGSGEYGFIKPDSLRDYGGNFDAMVKQKIPKRYDADFKQAIKDAAKFMVTGDNITGSEGIAGDDGVEDDDMDDDDLVDDVQPKKKASAAAAAAKSNDTKVKQKKTRGISKNLINDDDKKAKTSSPTKPSSKTVDEISSNHDDDVDDDVSSASGHESTPSSDDEDEMMLKPQKKSISSLSHHNAKKRKLHVTSSSSKVAVKKPKPSKHIIDDDDHHHITTDNSKMVELISELELHTSKDKFNRIESIRIIQLLKSYRPSVEEILSSNAIIINDLRRHDDVDVAAQAKDLRNIWKRAVEAKESSSSPSLSAKKKISSSNMMISKPVARSYTTINGAMPVNRTSLSSAAASSSSSSSVHAQAASMNDDDHVATSNVDMVANEELEVADVFAIDKLPMDVQGSVTRCRSIRLLQASCFSKLFTAIDIEAKLYAYVQGQLAAAVDGTSAGIYQQNIVKIAFAFQKPTLKRIKELIASRQYQGSYDIIFASSIANLAKL